MSPKPNRWLDLICREHSFVHEQHVRLLVTELQNSRKALHSTLVLVAQLGIIQTDLDSKYTLLYLVLVVEFSQSID